MVALGTEFFALACEKIAKVLSSMQFMLRVVIISLGEQEIRFFYEPKALVPGATLRVAKKIVTF